MTYTLLQNYWWILVALLGGLLVALMFVQGANIHLVNKKLDDTQKRMILNATGRKWELTFTTLVTFGGAFFASFPLFYSTSFGGAYWVWMLLLVTFVFQAVSYEFYAKKGNLLGMKAFRGALMANGVLAPFLVGTAVGTFFTGSGFTVDKTAIADPSAPIISTWDSAWHGLEALAHPHAVILGLTLVALAYLLGALYLLSRVNDPGVRAPSPWSAANTSRTCWRCPPCWGCSPWAWSWSSSASSAAVSPTSWTASGTPPRAPSS